MTYELQHFIQHRIQFVHLMQGFAALSVIGFAIHIPIYMYIKYLSLRYGVRKNNSKKKSHTTYIPLCRTRWRAKLKNHITDFLTNN